MSFRRIVLLSLIFATALCAGFAQAQSDNAGNGLIAFVNQSIDWYHRLQFPNQLFTDPSDSIYAAYNRSSSLRAISLIFDYARIQAEKLEHSRNGASSADNNQLSSKLPQLVASAQDRVKQATADLGALESQYARASGKKRQTIADQIAAQKSEIELCQARLETLQAMNDFATKGTSGGLIKKIDELERSVPEAQVERMIARGLRAPGKQPDAASRNEGPGKSSSSSETDAASSDEASTTALSLSPLPVAAPAAATSPGKQQSNGIISLAGELITTARKLNAERNAITATAQLRTALDGIRAPLRTQFRAITKRGDELSAAAQSTDPSELAERKKQIDALTADYKQLSQNTLPLAKANILLNATASNLDEWHGETKRTFAIQARSLFVRVAALGAVIICVMVASNFWRRAIFRYIHEQRRRNQFLLLRRIVVTVVIAVILVFALSTEIGSLATFAGFLTAGIAFALQNVILSVAAYFSLIGRYGIRVGDRIQIGGVTGDVVDMGLVRLHLVEVDTSSGEARPTGRIVAFSNSVVFQPSSNFFRQLPGSNFAWRRISLTLAADVDYAVAQECIHAAVNGVFETYEPELERQHGVLESSLAVHIASPKPQTRLRLENTGLEITVLYPVILSQAAQIDDRMTRALLKTIEAEPRLRLIGSGLTNINPVDTAGKTPAISTN
ncbi:MAG: hypothetical protein CXZ00_13665 [Acidobacteria bacterium]|nr:MAG: hypothetical protein CXZ00_13665 [Acidobacteriota bacterium]